MKLRSAPLTALAPPALSRRDALGLLWQGAVAATLVSCAEAPLPRAVPSPPVAPRSILLAARPKSIALDPQRTAVIVVDLQNDFGTKGGLFDHLGIDLGGVQRVAATTSAVLASARRQGMKVVYLKMAFRPDLSDMGSATSLNRVGHLAAGAGQPSTSPTGKLGRFLIRDTWNTEVLAAVAPQPGDIEIYKPRYSGFYQTDLHATLQQAGIEALIFTGCTTSVCVESTLRDAMYRDYLCVLLADCTCEPIGSDRPRTNHDATIAIVEAQFGWVSQAQHFVAALAALA